MVNFGYSDWADVLGLRILPKRLEYGGIVMRDPDADYFFAISVCCPPGTHLEAEALGFGYVMHARQLPDYGAAALFTRKHHAIPDVKTPARVLNISINRLGKSWHFSLVGWFLLSATSPRVLRKCPH